MTCKNGSNVTGASIGTVSALNVPPEFVYSECQVQLEVLNAVSAVWSSPDDPNLDNFISFTASNLSATFLYDTVVFGPITTCSGDTFVYYVSGYPLNNPCLPTDSLIMDTTYVVVYPSFTVEIDSMCNATNDSLLLTANVTSTATGCQYSFLWSTGDTTTMISVPNTDNQYSVTVTRSDLDSTVVNCIIVRDTIDVEAMFIECVNVPDIIFSCVQDPPESDTTLIGAGGCGFNPFIYFYDVSNGGEGCQLDSLIITRYYIVDFDGDTILTTTDRDSCIQRFIYVDNVPPVLMCPANITIQCADSTLPSNTGGPPTATDNCDPNPIVSNYSDVIVGGICSQEFTITRTWLATDACGNTSTCAQTIIVDDSTPPAISCPPNITIQCTASTLPSNTGTPTATDNCDTTPTVTFTNSIIAGSCPQERTIARTWRATDDCGNSSTCVQIIIVDDSTPPVIICPPNVTIQCNVSTSPSNTGSATATDNCDLSVTPAVLSNSTVTGSCPQQLTITRTWRATDDCGNSSTCVQIITVIDNVPPVISCPPNITIQCTASTLLPASGNATAVDNCDAFLTFTFNDVTVGGLCPQERTITRTWRATDDCGNSSTCNQIIVVDDSTPPVITCPVNVTIECTASTAPANTGTANTTDNCDQTPIISFTEVITNSPTCSQEYTITRTWRATDDCGNSSTCNQLIVVDDNTPPVISCPPNITIQCTASTNPNNTGSATATDNCDASVEITSTSTSIPGLCPQQLTITRTWRATDDCGNFSTCVQIITVIDIVPPVISCPPNITIQCTANTLPPATGNATAVDNCDGSPIFTFNDVTVGGICLQEGTITRTWMATDDCLNSSTCVQTITVQDTLAPVIACPADTIIDCTVSTVPASTGSATATDNCDLLVIPTFADMTIAGLCLQEYGITRTWTATDACFNNSTCIQVITIQDTTAPVWLTITGVLDTTLECSDASGIAFAQALFPVADDNCNADMTIIVELSGTFVAGACPEAGAYTNTWTVTDNCGNTSAMYTQIITIQDTTKPVITCPADITIVYPASTLPSNTGSATASDNCDPTLTITYTDSIPGEDCPQENILTRTWIATDDCGNSSSCQQTILIDDHGSICGKVEDDLGQPLDGVEIQLIADINGNEMFDAGDTLISTVLSASGTGNYCFTDLKPCNYLLVEIQPVTYGELFDYDFTPDPDGNDSLDGPDNQIPVSLLAIENDADNNFVDIICPTQLPVIPPDTICDNGSVVFEIDDLALGMLMYSWDFGSGSSPSSGLGLGPHTVSYITTTNNQTNGAIVAMTISKAGCPDLSGQVSLVEINPYPNAAISGSTSNLCYFTNRTFQPVASQIPGATYQWTFGSNAVPLTATGYGPHVVYYTSTGSKTVKLVIHPNEPGAQCPDSSTIMFNVVACPANIIGTVKSVSGAGISGVNVRLYTDNDFDGLADNNSFVRSIFTTTNPPGNYSMASIIPGNYVIIEIQPTGWLTVDDEDITEDGDIVPNIDSLDNLIPVTLGPSELDGGNNFIESPVPGSITGTVFIDLDNDEVPDVIEGLSDVTLHIYNDNNADGHADTLVPIATQVTNSSGFYSFTGVPIGNYVLAETQPICYISIKDFDASNDLDLVPNTNINNDTIPVTLTNGENDDQNYYIEEESILLVMNTSDSSPGSLRYVIECADDGDTILFDNALAGMTINITSSRIEIDKEITILSTLAPRVTIASEIPGLFRIVNNVIVEFSQLDIISGLTISGNMGAAFENFGDLKLYNVYIFRNPSLPPGEYLIRNMPNSNLFLSGNCYFKMD